MILSGYCKDLITFLYATRCRELLTAKIAKLAKDYTALFSVISDFREPFNAEEIYSLHALNAGIWREGEQGLKEAYR
jgi:hypothetical protein